MSETTENIRRKIESTLDLGSVVHTMKTLAAAGIGQYEDSVHALQAYERTVLLGLSICLRDRHTRSPGTGTAGKQLTGAVVFGSDQGLVGQFNEQLLTFVTGRLAGLPGEKKVWAVGERIYYRLVEEGLPMVKAYSVPRSVHAVTPLVGQLLTEIPADSFYIFHHAPGVGAAYEPSVQRLLPLDEQWVRQVTGQPWITDKIPSVIGDSGQTLSALVREYLFVTLFKACVESLAAEHASRLAAMQRAERNIADRLEELRQVYHHVRQNTIDEELFDIFSGYEALEEKESKN